MSNKIKDKLVFIANELGYSHYEFASSFIFDKNEESSLKFLEWYLGDKYAGEDLMVSEAN